MLAVREGKDAVCARNFSDALRKAVHEKRLMGRAVDGTDEQSSTGSSELDLNKLMEQMLRAGIGFSGGNTGGLRSRGGGEGGGDTGSHGSQDRDSKRRKIPAWPGDAPLQDPDLD